MGSSRYPSIPFLLSLHLEHQPCFVLIRQGIDKTLNHQKGGSYV